jgi:hypothetical protein
MKGLALRFPQAGGSPVSQRWRTWRGGRLAGMADTLVSRQANPDEAGSDFEAVETEKQG